VPIVVHYVVMGFLGGVAYVLVNKIEAERPEVLRRTALGAIVGLLVYLGGLPNFLTAFGLGYAATDVIEAVAERTRKKPAAPPGPP